MRFMAPSKSGTILFRPARITTYCGPKVIALTRLPAISRLISCPASVTALLDDTKEFARKELPKIYSAELIELLFTQPYCRISNLDKAGIAKRQTGAVYLSQLTDKGILTEQKIGREKIYINSRFLRLLTKEGNAYKL